MFAAGGFRQLSPQFADENVDDPQVRLLGAGIKLVQQKFLRQSVPFAQAEELQDLVFLGRDAQTLITDQRGAAVQVHEQLAGPHRGGGVALRAADDGMNARDQLASLKGLGQEIIGAEAEPLDLVVDLAEPRKDQQDRKSTRLNSSHRTSSRMPS